MVLEYQNSLSARLTATLLKPRFEVKIKLF